MNDIDIYLPIKSICSFTIFVCLSFSNQMINHKFIFLLIIAPYHFRQVFYISTKHSFFPAVYAVLRADLVDASPLWSGVPGKCMCICVCVMVICPFPTERWCTWKEVHVFSVIRECCDGLLVCCDVTRCALVYVCQHVYGQTKQRVPLLFKRVRISWGWDRGLLCWCVYHLIYKTAPD